MFEDIKNNQVVNGVKVIHEQPKSEYARFFSYGIGQKMRELTKEKITPRMQMEKEMLVKRMRNEYEAYKSIK